MTIWFTADQHLGHEEIITHCKRPFKNAKVMDESIIKNHNEIVKPNDDVYILGDFSMKTKNQRGDYERYTKRLNGRLHLIMGNHDIKDMRFYSEVGFYSVHYPYLEVEEFVCVHDPALSQMNRDIQFLCGHIHDLFSNLKNTLNVGVDVCNFKPLSIDNIRIFLKDK